MKLLNLIDNGLNICLIGEFGIGKTFWLNSIANHYNTRVLSSNPSLDELGFLLNTKLKSKKQAYSLLLNANRKVLVFDDLHESRKDTISMILKLSRVHTIVVSSENENKKLDFDFKNVKLKRLNESKSMKICQNLISNVKVCEKICKNAKGLPLLIIRGAEYYKVTGSVKTYFELDWKKLVLKRISVAAYICLSVRYFARFTNNWEIYSILSTVAYALLAMNRISKRL